MRGWISALIILTCILPARAFPCSSFIVTKDGSVLVGNNKDLRPSEQNALLYVVPARAGAFGKMYWGYGDQRTLCGVNDQGLFIDCSGVPALSSYSARGEQLPESASCMILDRCATVEEAIEMFRRYCVPQLCSSHYFIADRSGASAVIEYDGATLRVLEKHGDYQIMTNFRLTAPETGDHPCWRYNLLLRTLRRGGEAPLLVRDALEATHQEDLTYCSNIIDLTNGRMTVFGNHDYGQSRSFRIEDAVGNTAQQYTMEDLFPTRRVPIERLERRNGLVYEIGSVKPFSGVCFSRDGEGCLVREGRVKNGRCDGCWKYFDENGSLTHEDNFRRALHHYDNGMLRAEGMLKNNMMTGPWTWYNEDGSIALQGEAIDGMFYVAGNPHPFSGTMNALFRDGTPSCRRTFKRGLLEGEAVNWYSNGHIRFEGQFEEGRHVGQWRYYSRDGSLERVMLYEDYQDPRQMKSPGIH